MTDPLDTPPSAPSRSRVLAIVWGSFGFVALRFLLTPVRIKLLTTLLSREAYGGLMLISSTVAFASLALSLGAFEFLLRRLPGRPKCEQADLFRSVLGGLGAVGAAAVVVGGALLRRWPPSKLPADLAALPFAPPLLLAAMLVLLGCVFALLATHRYGRARWLQILAADLWFVPVAAMAALGSVRLHNVVLGWVGWAWASVAVGLVWTAPIGWRRARASGQYLREWLAFGLPLMPMVLGDWLFRLMDQYVLLAVRNVHVLAAYVLAVNIAMVGYFAGTAALDLLIAEFHRRRNARGAVDGPPPQDVREVVTAMVRVALAVGMATAAMLLGAGRSLVRLLSSAEYDDAAGLLRWTAAMPLAFMLVLIAGRLRAALGHTRQVGALTLGAAAVALALNLAWAPRWGGAGAAVANTVALGALATALAMPLRPRDWIIARELRPGRLALAAFVMAIGLAAAPHVAPTAGPAVHVLVAAAVCAAALVATGSIRRADLVLLSGSPQNPAHE